MGQANERSAREASKRLLWRVAGAVSLLLALIGIPLPLLPTTPFLILSAYCFSRGSERLHDWLVTHPRFGPPIRLWAEHRAISRKGKVLAMIALLAAFVSAWAFGVAVEVLIIQAITLVAVACFILGRPSPPKEEATSRDPAQ